MTERTNEQLAGAIAEEMSSREHTYEGCNTDLLQEVVDHLCENKYARGLHRLHVGAGFIAGSGLAWFVSEIVTTVPLTFYLAILGLVVFTAVALIDAWRLR